MLCGIGSERSVRSEMSCKQTRLPGDEKWGVNPQRAQDVSDVREPPSLLHGTLRESEVGLPILEGPSLVNRDRPTPALCLKRKLAQIRIRRGQDRHERRGMTAVLFEVRCCGGGGAPTVVREVRPGPSSGALQ